jgi:hypothetical protein
MTATYTCFPALKKKAEYLQNRFMMYYNYTFGLGYYCKTSSNYGIFNVNHESKDLL